MHEVLVNRLGGLSLPRKSVVRLTDRPGMTLDVYRGRKTTMQQHQLSLQFHLFFMFCAVQFLNVLILTFLCVLLFNLVKLTEMPPVCERAAIPACHLLFR